MFVCICNAVSDSQIRRCARAGACTLSDLQMRLGVACQCGICAETAVSVLNEELARTQECATAE